MKRMMMRFGDGLRDNSACINFRKIKVGKQQCIHLSDHKTKFVDHRSSSERERRHEKCIKKLHN